MGGATSQVRWARALACSVLALCGCGAAAFTVPTEAQPAFAQALEVPEPPPPARIEYVSPTPPEQGCRWVDGKWSWRGAGWRWEAGGWVHPPELCYYSLPELSWLARGPTGVLYYRPGRWYSSVEARICPDPPRCGPAATEPRGAAPGTEP
jgi:hypothetical protein